MASPWSLQKELCGLAKVRSAPKALWRLGVISEPSPDVTLQTVQDWTRGGAETYIYRFRVLERAAVHDVLLKAIVTFSVSRELREIADDWVSRRRLLDGEGIRTPALYCAKRAVLLEQFIPHKLSDVLRASDAPPRHLVDQVICYAAVLDRLGFCPLEPFHSLRTDGTAVFAVDFGQDLGPPGLAPRYGGKLLSEALQWLGRCGQDIDRRRAVSLYAHHVAHAKDGVTGWI